MQLNLSLCSFGINHIHTHPLRLRLEESLRVSGFDPESHSQVALVGGRGRLVRGVVHGVVGQRDAHLGLGDDVHLPEAEKEDSILDIINQCNMIRCCWGNSKLQSSDNFYAKLE